MGTKSGVLGCPCLEIGVRMAPMGGTQTACGKQAVRQTMCWPDSKQNDSLNRRLDNGRDSILTYRLCTSTHLRAWFLQRTKMYVSPAGATFSACLTACNQRLLQQAATGSTNGLEDGKTSSTCEMDQRQITCTWELEIGN